MKTANQKANKGRRNFLFALGAAGAGAATVAVIKQAPPLATPATSAEPQQGRGYQVTDHVRTYYKTARV
ncbi:MAG: formate dehydrogenase [Burkholderiales bacterium]|nr:formate dehydrogenase [Burkholderiales bacterium]